MSLGYSRPGKPTDNGFVENFNGRPQDECLTQNIFVTVAETRRILEDWREDSATVPTRLWDSKAPEAYRVQPINPQTRQEPLPIIIVNEMQHCVAALSCLVPVRVQLLPC